MLRQAGGRRQGLVVRGLSIQNGDGLSGCWMLLLLRFAQNSRCTWLHQKEPGPLPGSVEPWCGSTSPSVLCTCYMYLRVRQVPGQWGFSSPLGSLATFGGWARRHAAQSEAGLELQLLKLSTCKRASCQHFPNLEQAFQAWSNIHSHARCTILGALYLKSFQCALSTLPAARGQRPEITTLPLSARQCPSRAGAVLIIAIA